MTDSTGSETSILVISLNRRSAFDANIDPVLMAMWEAHSFRRVDSALSAIRQLSFHPPTVAVITDEAIASRTNYHVLGFLLHYIRKGGTAIFMGDFPRHLSADRVRGFFSQAGLAWEYSSLGTRPMFQNRLAVGWQRIEGPGRRRPMPPFFHLRGVFLKGVSHRDMLYQTTDPTEDPEDAAASVSTNIQTDVNLEGALRALDEATAIAVAEVGRGKLCYIGEMQRTTECTEIILALCGL